MSVPPEAPHQTRAIEAILDRPALLAQYGTGTGKTRIMVESAAALLEAFGGAVLILVPSSLVGQTYAEVVRWLGQEWASDYVSVIDAPLTIPQRAERLHSVAVGIVILSHESLSFPLIAGAVSSRSWNSVMVDEVSRFRNWSKRTRALIRLGQKAGRRYAFSGMVVVNRPTDLWYPMKFVDVGWCGITKFETFKHKFCELGGFTGTECQRLRPEMTKYLTALLDRRRITCTLSDVRTLPERETEVRRVGLSGQQATAYAELRDTLRLELEQESERGFELRVRTYVARMQRLLEIAAGFARNEQGAIAPLPSAKTTELVSLLRDDPDTPTIVWTYWVPEHFQVLHSLRTSGLDVSSDVEQWKRGAAPILVMQMAKGGFGLNLQRARRMIYHSLSFNLELMLQSVERNMRLDTEHEALSVVQLVAKGTLDEHVLKRLGEKATLAGTFTRAEALSMLRGD